MPKKGSKKPGTTPAVSGLLRRRKATRLQKRRYDKKTTRDYSPIPGSFKLTGQVFGIFKKHWRTLGGIMLVFLLLHIILVSGLSNINATFDNIKFYLEFQGGPQFISALNSFGVLVGSLGTSTSETASVLQTVLFILISLVIIWSLRHLLAGKSVRVKQAYYSAMAPLVPFLLVVLYMIVQFLPLLIGSFLAAAIASAIFPQGSAAMVIFGVVTFALSVYTIYLWSASIFALYVVTLPEMEPRKALRSAKNLVRFRRWTVIRRLIYLPIFILVAMAAIIVPLILLNFLVAPVFYVLSVLAILFVHTYLYSLYRGLLE